MSIRFLPLFVLIVLLGISAPQLNAQATQSSDAPTAEVIDQVATSGPFQPNWKSLENYEIPEWYKDAKLGIFIHWGLYSVPAFGSEWYPRNMYIEKDGWAGRVWRHHREKYGADFGYKDFIPDFKAEKFDAESWVKLFKDAGAKYIVPVAEHHDGFPMYANSYTQWDASEMGPKRDVIAELEKATRSAGLKFGVSSHRAFNWAYFVRRKEFDNSRPELEDFYGRAIPELFEKDAHDYKDDNYPLVQDVFKREWLLRTSELVTKFNPDLIWFDFGIAPNKKKPYSEQPFEEYLQKFSAFYYNYNAKNDREAIINYKWNAYPEKAAVLDLERSKMDKIRRPFWQTDTAVSSSSWGYTENQKYKSPDRLVDDLVDIVSKNGCLLLNVGPRSDGTIPQQDQDILLAIGAWLKVNGEAIYKSRPWTIYGEGPTGTATGHLSENKNKPFTPQDIRFTTVGGALYVTPLGWPKDGTVTVKSLAKNSELYPDEIKNVTLLGSDAKLKWTRDQEGLKVELPKEQPSKFAYVLKVTKS